MAESQYKIMAPVISKILSGDFEVSYSNENSGTTETPKKTLISATIKVDGAYKEILYILGDIYYYKDNLSSREMLILPKMVKDNIKDAITLKIK